MNNREIDLVMSKTGGSTLTREARQTALYQWRDALQKGLNLQVKTYADLKSKHVRAVVERWRAEGISARSIQNRMSHLRTALGVHGRAHFAARELATKALDLGASRAGTHRVPEDDKVRQAMLTLPDRAAAVAALQLGLGLRMREAISAGPTLKTWARQLEAGQRAQLDVIHGTKGGRPRTVNLSHPDARAAALAAVQMALRASDAGGGRVYPSASLQGACRGYQRDLASVGLSGQEASHALRYQWAQDQARRYEAEGMERPEVLARLSLDLGHGDGRGRYVEAVYLRGM